MNNGLQRAIPILLQRLALPGKDRNAAPGYGRRGMVLRGKDIATGPAHRRPQRGQTLDQHRRFHRHVQRAGDAHPRQRLAGRVFAPDGHEAGHFVLGDVNGLAPVFRQAQIFYFEVRFSVAVPGGGGRGAFGFAGGWQFDGRHKLGQVLSDAAVREVISRPSSIPPPCPSSPR